MKFITSWTIPCKNSSKDHKHYICFSLFLDKRSRSYIVYFEEVLNDKTKREEKIASFFSEKLAKSFSNALFNSLDNNLEKFKLENLSLRWKRLK
ncbi:MAG: hypothetical protein QXL09_00460 [Candidatus Aenigmatarchaeota archaeon]